MIVFKYIKLKKEIKKKENPYCRVNFEGQHI